MIGLGGLVDEAQQLDHAAVEGLASSDAAATLEAGAFFPSVIALATGGVRIVFADIEESRGLRAPDDRGCGSRAIERRLQKDHPPSHGSMKGSAAIETMPPARLARYGQVCGATLARAHARNGDAAKVTGYLGDYDTFDRALEQFAVAYADQNDADYAEFTDAAGEQRIEVERGV